jgi:hypothetical protein
MNAQQLAGLRAAVDRIGFQSLVTLNVEDDGTFGIIDGHHRYLASMLAGIPLDTVPTGKSSATLVTKWSEVMLVLDDWDTEAKIKMLNEIDASFNGMAVELLTELLQ